MEENLFKEDEKISRTCKELEIHNIQDSFRNIKRRTIIKSNIFLSERKLVNLERKMHIWDKKFPKKNLNASKTILDVPGVLNGAPGCQGLLRNLLNNQVPAEGGTSGCDGIWGPVPNLDQIPPLWVQDDRSRISPSSQTGPDAAISP